MSKTISTIQGDSIDLICWRHYGTTSGVVEQVLLANPTISELGVILPIGTKITLPDITQTQTDKATIQLWD